MKRNTHNDLTDYQREWIDEFARCLRKADADATRMYNSLSAMYSDAAEFDTETAMVVNGLRSCVEGIQSTLTALMRQNHPAKWATGDYPRNYKDSIKERKS